MPKSLSPLVTILLSAACLNAAQPAPPTFDSNRAYEDIRQLVAIGPRVAGTPGAAAARAYITKQLQAAGIKVEEQPFEATTPLGRVKMVNLRATLPAAGTAPSGPRLVIGGHYDTKLFRDFRFVGANDGGSSAAFLIELGRALKSRANRVPIELLFSTVRKRWVMARDRPHLRQPALRRGRATSRHAQGHSRLVLADMIGDRDRVIKRESNSTRALTDAI